MSDKTMVEDIMFIKRILQDVSVFHIDHTVRHNLTVHLDALVIKACRTEREEES